MPCRVHVCSRGVSIAQTPRGHAPTCCWPFGQSRFLCQNPDACSKCQISGYKGWHAEEQSGLANHASQYSTRCLACPTILCDTSGEPPSNFVACHWLRILILPCYDQAPWSSLVSLEQKQFKEGTFIYLLWASRKSSVLETHEKVCSYVFL